MVSFESFVKSMTPYLSELKVTPSFCFANKTHDDMTTSNVKGNLPETSSFSICPHGCAEQLSSIYGTWDA